MACGLCVDACPQVGGNEFDQGLKARKAIYRPFPQPAPAAFLIEKADRAPCVQTCPAGTTVQGYVALIKAGDADRASARARRHVQRFGEYMIEKEREGNAADQSH